MLRLIYGSDTKKSHEELQKLVAQFLKNGNPPALFRVDEESFSESFFSHLLKTENLFTGRNLVVSKRLLGNSLIADYILKNLDKLNGSDNIFLFWEEELGSDRLGLVKKHIAPSQLKSFSLKRESKNYAASGKALFAITDAFSSKQKEKTWLLCQEEFFKGTPAEEIFWKLVWQIKNLLAVKAGGGSDLHPFVYQKTKSFCSLFGEEELKENFTELVDLYHKDRRGEGDLSVGLEKFILKSI